MENNMGTAEMKQVTETVENVEFQMEKLQETVENMELMMEELKKTVENVEFQMEALKETVESMEVTTEELKESTESGFERMNVKLDHLTSALKTLQSQVDPAKLQVRNDKLDFQNVMDWLVIIVFGYYATSDVDRLINNCMYTFGFRGCSSLIPSTHFINDVILDEC
jgi:SMC interacting uncharacterized protein involved in chromosome segregation